MEWLLGILSFLAALLASVLPGHVALYHASSAPRAEATVVFVGDMMFDRSIRATIEQEGGDYIFSCIDQALAGADLVVGNLEGPITASSSVSLGSTVGSPENFTFTFATSTAELLARHNIRLVSIGNNHIMNFGRAGLGETRRWLSEAGVGYFGDPEAVESERVARIDVGGIPFSFINWSDWTSDKTDHTVAQIRAEAQSDRIVAVYTHWGDEYVPPPARVRELAHQMVDAGASIVIGSHPHIVQEHEIYNGRHIYYSLGNFIFDQYWNDAVSHGLMLAVAFDASGVASVEETGVVLSRDRRTCPLPSGS